LPSNYDVTRPCLLAAFSGLLTRNPQYHYSSEHWVEIVSEKKKYKLVGMAKENFPALPASN
jgi:hypothetical protein